MTQLAASPRNFWKGKTQQLTVFLKFQGGKMLLGALDGKSRCKALYFSS